MNREQMVALARRLLGLPENAELREREIGGGALCVYEPVMGGNTLIIDSDGSVLYGESACSFDELLEDFRQGLRTPLEEFDTDDED